MLEIFQMLGGTLAAHAGKLVSSVVVNIDTVKTSSREKNEDGWIMRRT